MTGFINHRLSPTFDRSLSTSLDLLAALNNEQYTMSATATQLLLQLTITIILCVYRLTLQLYYTFSLLKNARCTYMRTDRFLMALARRVIVCLGICSLYHNSVRLILHNDAHTFGVPIELSSVIILLSAVLRLRYQHSVMMYKQHHAVYKARPTKTRQYFRTPCYLTVTINTS